MNCYLLFFWLRQTTLVVKVALLCNARQFIILLCYYWPPYPTPVYWLLWWPPGRADPVTDLPTDFFCVIAWLVLLHPRWDPLTFWPDVILDGLCVCVKTIIHLLFPLTVFPGVLTIDHRKVFYAPLPIIPLLDDWCVTDWYFIVYSGSANPTTSIDVVVVSVGRWRPSHCWRCRNGDIVARRTDGEPYSELLLLFYCTYRYLLATTIIVFLFLYYYSNWVTTIYSGRDGIR